MTENARILLAILRDFNSSHIFISAALVGILQRNLGVTPEEYAQIGEILTADLREMNASYPGYGGLNDVLKRITGK